MGAGLDDDGPGRRSDHSNVTRRVARASTKLGTICRNADDTES
jgi:hypothetical protein